MNHSNDSNNGHSPNGLSNSNLSLDRFQAIRTIKSIWRYHKHLFACSPMLTMGSITINFILPFIIVRYFRSLSPLSLARMIRADKIDIKHRLIRGKHISAGSLLTLVALSMLYTAIQAAHQSIRNKYALVARVLLHRRVIERLLYCDLDQLKNHDASLMNSLSARSNQANNPSDQTSVRNSLNQQQTFASQLFDDIDDTVTFHQLTIPALLQSILDCSITMHKLYLQRLRIDVLAVARPVLISVINYLITAPIDHSVGHSVNRLIGIKSFSSTVSVDGERQVFCNVVDHLGEVQANSLQNSQLSRFNRLTRASINQSPSCSKLTTVAEAARANDHPYEFQAALDFVSETIIIRAAMSSKGLSHRKYMRIHADIDFATGLISSIYSLTQECVHVIQAKAHERVIAALEAPLAVSHGSCEQLQSSGLYKSSSSGNDKRRSSRVRFNINGRVAEPSPFTPENSQTLPGDIFKPDTSGFDGQAQSSEVLINVPLEHIDFHSIVIRRLYYQKHDSVTQHAASLRIDADDYAGEPFVFRRGQVYLVLGDECSSCSVFMSILGRLTRPSLIDCDMSVDGRPFHSIQPTSWQQSICYLSSKPFLFAGTVEDNIRCGDSSISSQDVKRAASLAGLYQVHPGHLHAKQAHDHSPPNLQETHDVVAKSFRYLQHQMTSLNRIIQSKASVLYDYLARPSRSSKSNYLSTITSEFLGLPNSSSRELVALIKPSQQNTTDSILSMVIHEEGTNVSPEFVQAIALARMFARSDISCVLIDDGLTEISSSIKRDIIFPALLELAHHQKVTVILTSQDLTVASGLADYVYVMDKGRITDRGSPDQLLKKLDDNKSISTTT